MERVTVELGVRSYEILIGEGILGGIGEGIRQFHCSPRVGVISNPTVFNHYGDTVTSSLNNAGFDCFHVLVPDGEEYKDYLWTYHILTELLKKKLDRNSCLVALGGGVVGDITGFVASLYMRGISFVQVPTTLLAQVDSSVGGKTGVNHYLGKNMIGTFYQPRLVWIDTETLKTLPQRELLSGFAEVIKYGVIRDAAFFQFLREQRDALLQLDGGPLIHVIKRSCEIKADVVSRDEREAGERAILNYGHTIGHALETASGYLRFLHGEAVAIGMHLEAKLSEVAGYTTGAEVSRICSLIKAYDLPTTSPGDISADDLVAHMSLDKKALQGELKFVFPETIGKVRIQGGVPVNIVRKVFEDETRSCC